MRIDIMTLFPDAIEAMMGQSIIGRARERGYIALYTHQIRDYTTNKQMQVDDYPYGGGRGAVMQADPLYRCWEHICGETEDRPYTIYLSPCGRVFDQLCLAAAVRIVSEERFLCPKAQHFKDMTGDIFADAAVTVTHIPISAGLWRELEHITMSLIGDIDFIPIGSAVGAEAVD